jgi:hypothetical protein
MNMACPRRTAFSEEPLAARTLGEQIDRSTYTQSNAHSLSNFDATDEPRLRIVSRLVPGHYFHCDKRQPLSSNVPDSQHLPIVPSFPDQFESGKDRGE